MPIPKPISAISGKTAHAAARPLAWKRLIKAPKEMQTAMIWSCARLSAKKPPTTIPVSYTHLDVYKRQVDARLHKIMHKIHEESLLHGRRSDGTVSYLHGANIAGFVKVADAIMAQVVI